MGPMYYIGLDVHKQKISYCVKDVIGKIHAEGWIPATRLDLDRWMKTLPQPWSAAMEATMFSGWVYDHLKPHAAELKVAHPLMLRAIAAPERYINTLFSELPFSGPPIPSAFRHQRSASFVDPAWCVGKIS
jgi:transposase